MKKFTLGLTVLCSIFSLASCSKTIQGPQGEQGIQGPQGEQGPAGENGSVVTIGENGNWFIDGKDTGVSATGANGDKGDKGDKGDIGLSAYEIYKKYHENYTGTEEDWINALASGELAKSYKTTYNIIYTVATIPPVLAALDSIDNGCETYAYIERGKTYSGIEKVDNFYNIGFNTSSNSSSGFTQHSFELVTNKIKELNVFGNEKFNIYVQDGTALLGLGVAANSKLYKNQYNIIMCEDGTGAYAALKTGYVNGKVISSSKDEIYDNYYTAVNNMQVTVDNILASSNHMIAESVFYYNIPNAFALAGIDNFTYWLQDKTQIKDILEKASTGSTKTKLLSSFEIEGYEEKNDLKLNVKYESINECVAKLNDKDKTKYLTLMYGNYYNDTYNTLTRTTLSDGTTSVPDKKLVFIGTRIKNSPNMISLLGIGNATSASEVPDEYNLLDKKYKNSLLFPNEEDYMVLINSVNNDTSYLSAPTQEQKEAIRVQCFNYYLNYILTIKYTYAQYGSDYDIIMKGHPSEVLGAYQNWTSHYTANGYVYDKLINDVFLAFHQQDSIGKYVGMVPYGTAAENLAYLGANISIGGLNSSTYTGYDTSVDVLFVLETTNSNITSNTNLNSRYEAGNLIYHKESEEFNTKYDNNGNILKTLVKIYTSSGETELAASYQTKFENWLKSTFNLEEVGSHDIDDQGFLK